MEDEESSDEEYLDFKLPSIVNQIRGLLEQYSDGQILKELIQNAEDGDATEMKVLYVKKEHQYSTPSKSWKSDAIKFATKGPALCVYNNGLFSKRDWEGIAAIQCSTKENEPFKVGRFGLGFKSVFHITDHPMIVSGKRLMVMNPLTESGHGVVYHKHLAKVDDSSRKAMLNIMDGLFGFSSDVFQEGYSGTMFWFPVRVAESGLSKVTYDYKKIYDIFRGFRTTAPSLLLFLKQIGRIELHELKHNKPNLIYSVQKISENIEYNRTKRNSFFERIENLHGRLANSSLSNMFTQKIRCEGFGWLEERVSETSWLVMDYYQGGSVSRELTALTEDTDWSYSPYVSIAVSLSNQSINFDGHIFCFLPLPQETNRLTGLPVHVNGFFALSQDRHHIKWTSHEQDDNSHTEKSVQWNKLLVSEVLPRVYADIMKEIIADADNSVERIYSMLPNPQFVAENWTSIIDPLYKYLFSTQIIYTKQNTGEWVLPQKALILSNDSHESILRSLEEVYLLLGNTVARVPEFVTDMLEKHGTIHYTSIEKLWIKLKSGGEYIYRKMNREQQINLLRYVLNTDRTHLQDLKLLPLANNTFTTFSNRSTAIVYICSEDEYAMFPNMEVHFVDFQIDDIILQQLAAISEEEQFQLRTLQASAVPELLQACIKINKLSSTKITRELDAWLTSVWQYIGKHKLEIINRIAHLPLLPWTDGRNNSKLIKLNCLSILKSKYGVGTLDRDIANALEKLHVTVFTSMPDNIMDIVSGKYVQFPTAEGIFKCLENITTDEALCENSIQSFNSKATIAEKKILLAILSNMGEIRILRSKGFIRRLHLFSLTDDTQMNTCLEDVNQMYDGIEKFRIPVEPVSMILKCGDYSTKRVAEMCGVEILHVPLLTDRVLSNVDAFDMNFGQDEPLTTRLRNILEDYTDGFTIPKELIQNADDAGATVVKFMYDERTLPEAQTCLFNEGMLPCQGPAFWAFNDAQFHQEDFDAITRLAGATKKQDSMKIGRFGLGFNSVYNLTDVPSFISGDTYVIFDPHQTHLKRCGLKVKLNDHKNYVIRQKMKGQLYPFEGIFGCEVVNKDQINFKGTLFRFPLRSQEEASKSKIKDLCYSKTEMKKFVRKLKEGAGNLLLFTQNVKKIELFYLAKGAQPSKKKLLMEVFKSSDYSNGSVLQYLRERSITDHKAPQLSETIEIKLTVSEFSKNIFAIEKLDCTKPYLVSWSFGKNKALEAVKQTEFKGLLPVAATAVPLETCDNTKRKSHLFCFLPLPIKSQLPVHINAFFAVNSSRRELVWQNEDDKDIPKYTWNKLILADAGSEAYNLMLQTLAPLWSAKRYFELWPTVVTEAVSRHDHILSNNVYGNICTENYKVFPTGDTVVSLSEAVFLDPKLQAEKGVGKGVGSIAFKAFQHFVNIEKVCGDVYVVDLSQHLLLQFKRAQCEQYVKDRTVSMQDFYSKIVFSNMSDSYWTNEDLDALILFGILNRDEVIDKLISSSDCIPTKPNGLRKQPRNMVHPLGDIAKLFSAEEECFPQDTNTNNFCRYDVLPHLSDLGMQKNDLHWDKLPERIIFALESQNAKLIKERCCNFLKYMCIQDENKQTKYEICPKNIQEKIGKLPFLSLKEATWLFPVYKTKMPIPFISPVEGHMPELRNLVGCTLPIIDTQLYRNIHHASDVLKWLGVKHVRIKLDVGFVVENILTMINHYIESTQSNKLFIDLQRSLEEMYSYLCTLIDDGNDETIRQIAELLKDQPVFLHIKSLKLPVKMILNLDANVEPYLFKVEIRHHKYASLFKLLGVLDKLTPQKIVDILLEVAEEKGNDKLTTKEIDCIVSLSNEFSKCSNQDDTDKTGVKLPNDDGVLTLCAELCIDDSPWLINTNINSVRHIHESFSKKIAESFDVKSKRSHDFDSISSPIFSEFGQHEELTTRIRRILEGYPCDESILKEMLQNADDAGATEVIFIKDFRDLSKKSLPDPLLGEAQGPALCVYNDSFLTSGDLKGIQDLGLGSKKDEMLTTGQYGVGFNVVYHVTDVPSFWTKGGDVGEVICIFDPQSKYLSNTNCNRPGIQIKAAGLQENYPDFIDGYIPDFTQSLRQGTLFRLPLRTKDKAETSKINQEYITVERIEDIINVLKQNILSCLLFLENIKTVKIGSVVGGKLTIEYEVTASMSTADNEKQMQYNTYLKERSGKLDKKHDDAFYLPNEIDIILNIEDKSWQCSDQVLPYTEGDLHPHKDQYLVIKRAGFLDDVCLPEKFNLEYKQGKIKKIPRGGIAIRLEGIAQGMAYCTLPLPVQTGLPLHVNGQFALDHESRRNIYNDMNSVSGMWNTLLRKYLIVPAYISALGVFKKYLFSQRKTNMSLLILHKTIQQFEDIFPKIENATDVFWKALSTDIYVSMAATKVELFPVVKNCSSIDWVAVQTDGEFNGCFNTLMDYFKPCELIDAKVTPKYVRMEMILINLGMKVLKSSRWILSQFHKADVAVQIISPETVLTFIKSFSNNEIKTRCMLGELPSLISKTSFETVSNFKIVLKFVVRNIDVDKDEANCLYGSPLLLRQNDMLEVFYQQSTAIVSSYCNLFQEHSSMFLSQEIVGVMSKFVGKFKPLIHWTLANFAGLFARTNKYNFLCKREIINLNLVDITWVLKLWQFIRESLPKQKNTFEPEKLSSGSSSFKLLEKFSILPVMTASGECLLYPLCYADHVMDYLSAGSSTVGLNTRDILYSLNIPILYFSNPVEINVRNRDYYKTLEETVAKLDDPNSILEVLLHNESCLTGVDYTVSLGILEYFNHNIKDITSFNKNKIRKLGMFETHCRSLISLNVNNEYICLNDNLVPRVPTDGLQHWESTTGIVILRYHDKLKTLYEHISVVIVEPADLYSLFILRHIHSFKNDHHIVHFKYIRDTLLVSVNIRDKNNLICQLKDVSFIPHSDGTMKKASAYFDQTNAVFKVMQSQSYFVPHPFNNPEWRDFLLLAGLVAEVSVELYIKYARTVEQHGLQDCTDAVIHQSRVLVKHLFSRANLIEEELCQKIKGVRFVERIMFDKGDFRRKIHKLISNTTKLIAFEDSYQEINLDYVWTVANVLPWNVGERCLTELLGIKSEVTTDLFVQHFMNICSSLQHTIKDIEEEKLESLFETLYKFMQKLKSTDMTRIQACHAIYLPQEKCMVEASKFILKSRPEQLIKHQIFEAPVVFGKYFDVFKMLGARETAEPDMYLEVLQDLHCICSGRELHPNESTVVKRCIIQLNYLWSNTTTSEQIDYQVKCLYLPSEKTILTPSTELVLMDNSFIKERVSQLDLQYFVGFKELEIKSEDSITIHGKWPKKYQMNRLSKVVVERLKPDCRAVVGNISTDVNNRLKHSEMQTAFIRLMRHKYEEFGFTQESCEEADTKLETVTDVNIFEVEKLTTALFYKNQMVTGSEIQRKVFTVETSETNNVYIDTDISDDDMLVTLLSQLVNKIFGIEILYFSRLWELIKTNPSNISNWLDQHGIRSSDYMSNTRKYLLFPPPGHFIPEKHYWLLDNSFREFDEGEYVGYEVFDPDLEDDIPGDNPFPVYIYAIVNKILQEDTNTDFAHYSIDIGEDDMLTVNATKIYKFYRNVTAIVPGNQVPNTEINDPEDSDINNILQEIRKTLVRAWHLPEKDRKRVIKRLLLQWHPDKNTHNTILATTVTQKLLFYIERLNNGQTIEEEDTEFDTTDGASNSRNNYYGNFCSRMHSRGSRYAQYSEEQRSNRRYYSDNSFHTQSEPNPQPGQASRWLRQARYDLQAAKHSVDSNAATHNWICYKCQQAAEKALKAVWYMIDANKVTLDHNLHRVAVGLQYTDLVHLTSQLQSRIGEHTRMRYPDTLSYPSIPHDVYNISHSTEACQLTESIISRASEILAGRNEL